MTTGKMVTAVVIVLVTALAYQHGAVSTPIVWFIILCLMAWGIMIPVRR